MLIRTDVNYREKIAQICQEFLSAKEAARRLGISTTTLYDWLCNSDHGLLMLRGQRVTVEYFQSGRRGQGRIQIESNEVQRIRELMRVRPHCSVPRRPPTRRETYPGITVPLGKPRN